MWFVAAASDVLQRLVGSPEYEGLTGEGRLKLLLRTFGDYATTARSLTVGVPLVMSAGDLNVKIGHFAIGGITMSTIAALVIYHLFVETEQRI